MQITMIHGLISLMLLAKAYHDTIQHFYDLGARYVRLDDTTWGIGFNSFENEKIILRKQLSWQNC